MSLTPAARGFALDAEDRRRLRLIVMKVYMRFHPAHLMTDHEADRIIDTIAPETMENLLMKGISSDIVPPRTVIDLGAAQKMSRVRKVSPRLAFADMLGGSTFHTAPPLKPPASKP